MKFREKEFFSPIYESDLFPEDLNRVAFIFKESETTYGDIQKQVDIYCANLIAMGVKKGDKVGYTLPNCPDTFYLYMALSRLGACAIPLFHMIPDQGKVGIWANCGARFAVTSAAQLPTLQETAAQMKFPLQFATIDASEAYSFDQAIDTSTVSSAVITSGGEDLPVMMASSSGTTGTAKYVEMTQKNAATVLKASYELMQPKEDGYSLVLAFPLSTSGILVCMGMVAAGITMIFSDDMAPHTFLGLVDKYKADAISAPPAYLEAITYIPGVDNLNFDSVKRVYTGMDFFPNKQLKGMRRRFSNLCMAGNGYGLIETSTVLMTWNAESLEDFDNATNRMTPVANIGNEFAVKSAEGKDIPVGDTGELFIKGNSIVKEYYRNSEETEKAFFDGWFRTGDIATAHEDGTISLLGRNKYVIKRGGRSVSPIEISAEINKVEAVLASAVVGVPHQMFGEMVWAFVVTPPGVDLPEGVIMKQCRENLPPYMVPDQITYIDQIPKNPGVGKLNFEKLKEIALEKLTAMNGEADA